MRFSIIIPTYNNEFMLLNTIKTLQKQTFKNFEIIVIDDCSTEKYTDLFKIQGIRIYQTDKNSGPGIARNIGLEKAQGEYILFLDDDDFLSNNALEELDKYINNQDAVFYNWKYTDGSGGRFDIESLKKNKEELLNDYLSGWMDHSAIFAVYRNSFLKSENIFFSEGYHEDVDFMFNVYLKANNIGYLSKVLYYKRNRENSIINTFGEKHIKGFFDSYKRIYDILNKENLVKNYYESYYRGCLSVFYTIFRRIEKFKKNRHLFYTLLYKNWKNLENNYIKKKPEGFFETKYYLLNKKFIRLYESGNIENISDMFEQYDLYAWSCYDLDSSVFLSYNEIRVCCKRFFVNNERKGDVVLISENEEITAEKIIQKKKELFLRINRGIAYECMGCPFLKFEKRKHNFNNIEYISFEYHSKCNMRCVYCDDRYYGGNNPRYDIVKLIKEFNQKRMLKNCKYIVWGGGEPVLDKNFDTLLEYVSSICKNVKQKIITNATVFNEKVFEMINTDKAYIITSIDAGKEHTFYKIRNYRYFEKVFVNLKKYAEKKARNVIIKYIFLENNSSDEEVEGFIEMIKKYNLQNVNFQISYDFKEKNINLSVLKAALKMYKMLLSLGVRFIFFDDLFYQRLNEEKFLSSIYADYIKFDKVVIWGAGDKTKNYLLKNLKKMNVTVEFIVDESKEKIGKKLFDIEIKHPACLLETDHPIIISSYNYGFEIMNKIEDMGIDTKRVVKGII